MTTTASGSPPATFPADGPLTVTASGSEACTPRPGSRVFIVRDIPESCICLWDWDEHLAKWQIVKQLPGCPWHEGG